MIQFYYEEISSPEFNASKVKHWIKSIINIHKMQTGDISFIFCSDSYLLNINREYLSHDYFTDIITFNYNEGTKISGDIFISVDTVCKNSIEYEVTLHDELLRVMIHGILHLIGYNDSTSNESEEMRKQENIALQCYNS